MSVNARLTAAIVSVCECTTYGCGRKCLWIHDLRKSACKWLWMHDLRKIVVSPLLTRVYISPLLTRVYDFGLFWPLFLQCLTFLLFLQCLTFLLFLMPLTILLFLGSQTIQKTKVSGENRGHFLGHFWFLITSVFVGVYQYLGHLGHFFPIVPPHPTTNLYK